MNISECRYQSSSLLKCSVLGELLFEATKDIIEHSVDEVRSSKETPFKK